MSDPKEKPAPNQPERNIPTKPDTNPDPSRKMPEKNDPTRKQPNPDPTRIDPPNPGQPTSY